VACPFLMQGPEGPSNFWIIPLPGCYSLKTSQNLNRPIKPSMWFSSVEQPASNVHPDNLNPILKNSQWKGPPVPHRGMAKIPSPTYGSGRFQKHQKSTGPSTKNTWHMAANTQQGGGRVCVCSTQHTHDALRRDVASYPHQGGRGPKGACSTRGNQPGVRCVRCGWLLTPERTQAERGLQHKVQPARCVLCAMWLATHTKEDAGRKGPAA
jgi:hypothetical protein